LANRFSLVFISAILREVLAWRPHKLFDSHVGLLNRWWSNFHDLGATKRSAQNDLHNFAINKFAWTVLTVLLLDQEAKLSHLQNTFRFDNDAD
jgi:hypothetical protein